MSELASLILGAIMPQIVDYFRAKFNVGESLPAYWLTLVICAIAGLCVVYIDNGVEMTLDSILSNLGIIFVTSQTVYKTYWEDSSERETFITRVK